MTHTSNRSNARLSLSDISSGQAVMNNLGFGSADISWGGNDDSNMNFGRDHGSIFSSRGGGISASASPVSFTQTIGWTGIRRLSIQQP